MSDADRDGRVGVPVGGRRLPAADDAPPVDRFLWGGAVQIGDPRGAFGDVADTGVGALIHATMRTGSGTLGWRVEGGWLVYGSESLGVPVPGTQRPRDARRGLHRELGRARW